MHTSRFQPAAATKRLGPSSMKAMQLSSWSPKPSKTFRHCPLLKFHMRSVPSCAPVMSRRPLESKVIAQIFESPCAWWKLNTGSPRSAEYTVTPEASSQSTTCRNCGLKSAQVDGCTVSSERSTRSQLTRRLLPSRWRSAASRSTCS